MKKIFHITLIILLVFIASCRNDDWSFPDYKYQAVYFAYQYPVRTIVLGDNIFSTDLDNKHQFSIMATTAGVYNNNKDVKIDFEIDSSLLKNLLFEAGGDDIEPLPSKYYSIESNQIVIPKGELIGGVKIHLSDDFFKDPKALKKAYVLSLRMTGVENADTILSGQPKELVHDPKRGHVEDWEIQPKDFTFYAVKFINKWEGFYLCRGRDVIKGDPGYENLDSVSIRHEDFVVDDQVVKLNTVSLTETEFSVVYKNKMGQNTTVTLILKFGKNGNISFSDNANGYDVSGTGKFIKNGAKDSWGGEDHNLITLDYEVKFNNYTIHTKDTLIMRNRGVSMETFSPVLK